MLQIGDLSLDLAAGRLRGSDGDIEIRPKTFAMLSHLARHAGQVVPKDVLMAMVWPDVTVSDDSLSQCAHDLRRALGPDHRTRLRTFARRGYMLDLPPQPAPPAPGHPEERVRPTCLAVLPFGHAPDLNDRQRRVFDGLAHDLITGLAGLGRFHVVGRRSAFALRDMADDPRGLRQLLGVAHVVTGSVLPARRGHRLQLDLVRTDLGTLVWTEAFALDEHAGREATSAITRRCAAAVCAAIPPGPGWRAAP